MVAREARKGIEDDDIRVVTAMINDEAGAIAAWRDGDIRGLEPLVHQHQHRALRVALHITTNREVAEDVVAEAFLTVYDHIAQYDSRRPFAPWFYRIVVNSALRAVSRRKKMYSAADALRAVEAHEASPEREVVRREQQEVVVAAIEQLPPKQRAALTLRYYLDMDEATIATTLGVPVGTVKWRLHAARRKVRASLARIEVIATARSEGGT